MKALSAKTRLALPRGGFDVAAGLVRAQIDQQVQASEELTEMVATLEGNYERFMSERSLRSAQNESLPSADEIGRQFESFLAGLGDDAPTVSDPEAPDSSPTASQQDAPDAGTPAASDETTTREDRPDQD